jgi:hypothetical protein|tara:strand:+ start:602 stop:844 length:243 start_codon:yes stop_codon:yes gene_type:complete
MAALYGRLQGNRQEVTRCGHDTIKAKLETWDGSIAVYLGKDGTFAVHVGDKSGLGAPAVLTGNVDTRRVDFHAAEESETA